MYSSQAYDPDLDDEIRYVFDDDGITADGDYIDGVVSTAFTLESSTGILRLNFEVLATMRGYFEFKIVAYDKGTYYHFIRTKTGPFTK